MRLLAIGFVVAFTSCHAVANPIAIDGERRHAEMLSETVEISVGADRSQVWGQFRFRQEAPFSKKHTHVTIFVPVLLPVGFSDKDYATRYDLPSIEVSGRRFVAEPWNDISLAGSPDSVGNLPKGWSSRLFVCQVPLEGLRETFDVKVSYVQPHFPHGMSAYMPVRPPRDERECSIRFSADKGRALRRKSLFSALASNEQVLVFTPKDRVLIQVKSVPVGMK